MARRIYIGTASTPAAATVDTADQGFFWGVNINHPIVTTTSAAVLGSNDQVKVKQFVLPFRVVVGLISFDVTTLEAATNGGLGLYDAGGSLVVETGAIDVSSTGIQQITISPTSTLEPGVYFLAYTADGTTARFRGINTGSNTDNLLNAGSVAKAGRAANSSSSGVLPATLGTITAENGNPMALVLFGR